MKPEEFILSLILAMGFCFCVGLIFYENIIISAVLSLVGVFYIPMRKKEQLRKRRETLNLQFKDALYFLSVSISAGKSFETALMDTERALMGIYPDQECDMIRELEIINKLILMNTPVEKAFYDLAGRSGVEDIKNFADVVSISKRAGANLIEVINDTSAAIREKIEMRQEIDNLIAAKRFEQKILTVMPFILVLLLKSSGSDFMAPLMNTAHGHFIMTIALIMILIGILTGRKIMHIEV